MDSPSVRPDRKRQGDSAAMSNPSSPLEVILISRQACDPALNLSHKDAPRLLSAYERTRSEADRAALPLVPGATPIQFTLKPLTAAALRFVKETANEETRLQRAVMSACHSYKDEKGMEHSAHNHGRSIEVDSKFSVGSDEWLEHLLVNFGNAAIMELAAVVLQRAEASPRALAPFLLPRGLMLPV